jgi:hypothetical protein
MKFYLLLLLALAGPAVYAGDLKTPNMSANALFLYRNSNYHAENINLTTPDQTPNGVSLQEAELQFYSDVDPYTRMSLLLSIHSQYEGNGTTVEEKWMIEPEEAFVESNAVDNITFKIGKFKAALGKHNTMHTHAYPFINPPLANVALVGDEGLNDVGASAAGLLPVSWFSEVTLQYLRGAGENAEFSSPTPNDGVGLVHFKNLVDLSDALTLEVGASYAQGANAVSGDTSLAGGDLTFKWRPTNGGLYTSVLWATEYLSRSQTQPGLNNEKASGVATWVQYQFAERWAGLYRYDNLTVENTFDAVNLPNDTSERNSLALVYMPSEFASYKLEGDRRTGGALGPHGETTENSIFLQANFTIGAHPAHSY